jgi:hypothetical protein
MSANLIKTATSQKSGWIWTWSNTFENSDVAVATAASIQWVMFSNKSASVLYLWLVDSATVPSSGTPIVSPIIMAAGATQKIVFDDSVGSGYSGVAVSAGLAWIASTSATSISADSTNSVALTVRYLS